jgi:hypothetical protein
MEQILLKFVNAAISLVLSAALFTTAAFIAALACVLVMHFMDAIRTFIH